MSSILDIRELVQRKLHKRACLWQIKIAQALDDKSDVIGVAATGAGKTLTFYIPLLMALERGEDKMIFIITPLNLLGVQNAESEMLKNAGIPAVAISAQTATKDIYKVCLLVLLKWTTR